MRILLPLLIALLILDSAYSVLPVPVQIAPLDGATDKYPNVMLDFSTVSGATYEIRIGTDPSMTSFDVYPSASSYYYTSSLKFGINYYWQVRAIDTTPDSSDWSPVWSFSTRDYVTQLSPATGSVGQYPSNQLDWGVFDGITYYEYELDTVDTFDSPLYQTGLTGVSSFHYTSNLRFGTRYYWRVRAGHCCDTTSWSTIWDFTTRDEVIQVSPANGTVNQNPYIQIDWSAVTGAVGYLYEVDTVNTFDSPVFTTGATTNSYYYNMELYFGKTYYWRVCAYHLSDTSAWSSVWSFSTTDNISLVSPSNASSGQYPNVQIDWTGITGATAYLYEIDIVNTFDSPVLETGVEPNSYHNNIDLNFGQTYYWRVRAYHANDTTQWSAVWSFSTVNSLNLISPANGAVDQNSNTQLDWSNISGSTGYYYEIDTVNSFDSPYYQTGTAFSSYYNCSDLLFGEQFYWRVRAFNSNDTSAWSPVWSFSTQNMLTHASPIDGSSNHAPNVTIDWSYMSGITNYDYEIDTSFFFNSPLYEQHTLTSSSSQIALSDLRFGSRYWWRVRARHAQDTTEWTDAWSFTTTDMLSNNAPADGAINQLPNVTIDWSYLSGIIYYDYELDTAITFSSPIHGIYTVSNSASQVALSNLLFDKIYYWRVRARHNVDTTQWSSIWSFSTADGVSHVSPSDGSVDISLNPTIDWSYLGGISNYHYQYDTDPNFTAPNYFSIGSASSQANLSNLSYGETYYWQVRVAHGADTSSWTTPWEFRTLYQLTSAPVLASPANGTSGVSLPVNIQWLAYTGAVFYEYEIDTSSSFINPFSGNTGNLNENITGLIYGESYYWRVRANNGSGYTPWSNVWSFTVGDIGVPNPISPANGSSGLSVTSVLLDWSDVPMAVDYEYEYRPDPAFVANVSGGTSTLSGTSISGLDYGITYYWRVRANDGISYSMWSAVWSFTTELISLNTVDLNLPSNGAGYQLVNGLLLNWFSVSSADEYRLEYSPDPGMSYGVVAISVNDTFEILNGLDYSLQYYWRVRAVELPANYGPWSSIWSFTTEDDPFGAPVLVSPADYSIDQVYNNLLLDWTDVVNAQSYEYHYSMDSLFLTYSAGSVVPSEVTISGLQYLTQYYWRVRAYNGASLSDWSDTLSFMTQDDVTNISVIAGRGICIYPNPSFNTLIIYGGGAEVCLVELYDLSGKKLYHDDFIGSMHSIDVSAYKAGVYLLKIYCTKETLFEKVVIRN